ncbi:MAG: ABC transporter substrate-binding protein [Frankiaceae bacterium]|nr:ABC transporter substrate-binding protein [Frankiaceae bacterium]
MLIAAILIGAVPLPACTAGPGLARRLQAAALSAPDGPAQPGGTYTYVAAAEAPGLDPQARASSATQESVSGLVYSKLLEFAAGAGIPYSSATLEPQLAQSWDHSADWRTWTFRLRAGVKFQNIAPVGGREFTSADVACTVKRMKTLPGAQARLLSVVREVRTPDPFIAVFSLAMPFGTFDQVVADDAMVILPCEGVRGEFDLDDTAIGTGPFLLAEWNRGTDKTYLKNPDYFVAGQPYLDEIRQVIIADPSAALAAFRAGQVDSLSITEALLPALRAAEPRAVVDRLMGAGEAVTFFNLDEAPFDDYQVRKAVMLAIDRDGEARELGYSDYQLSGPIPPTLYGGMSPAESAQSAPYDPAQAKALLAGAGYPSGFSVTLTTSDTWGPDMMSRVRALQGDLTAIGITATLRVLDGAGFASAWRAGNYRMGFGYLPGMLSADDYLSSLWRSDGARNWFNIDDDALDQMIDEQRALPNGDARAGKLADINAYILEHIADPLMSYLTGAIWVRAPYVRNAYPHPEYAGGYLQSVWLDPRAPGKKGGPLRGALEICRLFIRLAIG